MTLCTIIVHLRVHIERDVIIILSFPGIHAAIVLISSVIVFLVATNHIEMVLIISSRTLVGITLVSILVNGTLVRPLVQILVGTLVLINTIVTRRTTVIMLAVVAIISIIAIVILATIVVALVVGYTLVT